MRRDTEENKGLQGYSSWGKAQDPTDALELDRALIRMAQGGDQQAVSELYARHQRGMLNYLYRFTGSREEAEDLRQETFVRVVRNLNSYRPTGSVAGWIYRIARNLALNSLRDRKARREVSLDEPQVDEAGKETSRMERIPDSGRKPDQQTDRIETEQAVQKALLEVPPQYREALIFCDIQGCAYKEAAQILHCPIDTVASRLARGRAKLAKLLGYLKGEVAP